MSINRWAKRRDATEAPIVNDLRKLGFQVRRQDFPDLLIRRRSTGQLYLLEVDGITRYRKRSDEQLAFLHEWGIPIVKDIEGALAVMT